MSNIIASPHWEACESCKHERIVGCGLVDITMEHDAIQDAIICEDYERKSTP